MNHVVYRTKRHLLHSLIHCIALHPSIGPQVEQFYHVCHPSPALVYPLYFSNKQQADSFLLLSPSHLLNLLLSCQTNHFSLKMDAKSVKPCDIKEGVQISNGSFVTNIPSGMVTDQFGMIGLLAFLRAAETDPNLASVTLGTDLTALGLNLSATDKLYPSFAGPWADQPLKVYEVDYPVPVEYMVNHAIRDKLTQITLKRYHEDTIFFLFYMFPEDMLQIAAAIELYSREWRYHKQEKVWITRALGIAPSEKTNTYERGTYYIFDAHLWRRVPREFVLQYDQLESKPTI